jgi:two-component system, LytTR family, response regulator
MEERKSSPSKEQIELLLQNIKQNAKTTTQRIALTTGDGMIFVPTQDILYCAAESNYTSIVLTGGKKILVSKVLKEIDETLSGPDFFRIHNSYLINLNHIKKYVRGEGGYIIMDDGANISISRSKRQEFMDQFSKF